MKLVEWILGPDDGASWLLDKNTYKSLYGNDLQFHASEIRELDEFKDRDVVFINNNRIYFDDNSIFEVKNIECHIDDYRILNEIFEPIGTIFIFGITYLPDRKIFNLKFLIFNENTVRVKIFNNSHPNDLQIDINGWLQKIGQNYTITNIKQSSSMSNGYTNNVVSVWYEKNLAYNPLPFGYHE